MTHSTFASPSGSDKWLYCAGSSQAQQYMPDLYNHVREEGHAAHTHLEMSLELDVSPYYFLDKTFNNIKVTREQCADVNEYIKYLKKPGLEIFTEEKISAKCGNYEIFGTLDIWRYDKTTETLYVDDFKYGYVAVDIKLNSQLWIYAWLLLKKIKKSIKKIVISIFQPRVQVGKTFKSTTINPGVLLNWGATVLKQAVEDAHNPNAKRTPGKHCKYCKAKITCPEYLEYSGYNIEPPHPLTPEFIGMMQQKKPAITNMFKQCDDIGTQMLLRGVPVPGCKLVEKTKHNQLKDRDKIAASLVASGVSDDCVYDKKVKNPSALKKSIPKQYHEIIDTNTYKPRGDKTIALLEDNRIAVASSKDIFKGN